MGTRGTHKPAYLLVVLRGVGLVAVIGVLVRPGRVVVAGSNKGVGRGQVLHHLVFLPSSRRLRMELN